MDRNGRVVVVSRGVNAHAVGLPIKACSYKYGKKTEAACVGAIAFACALFIFFLDSVFFASDQCVRRNFDNNVS